MPLLPYARLDDAIEAAKTAAPIAMGGFPAIIEQKRLFCQCLVTIESFGLNAALPDQPVAFPQLSRDTQKILENLRDGLKALPGHQFHAGVAEAKIPPWVLTLLIQVILTIIDEWLNP